MAKSLISKTQLSTNVSDIVGEYGSGYFLPIASPEVVFTSNDQTISGTKTFISNSILYSGVNVNFDSNTIVKFSGEVTFTDNIYSNRLVYNSGDQTISGIKTFTLRPMVGTTGILLSGEAVSFSNLFSTGSTLDSKINSLSGTLTGNYATITNLASTGSTLDAKINSLSGNLTGNYATITNLGSTGSTLNSSINSLSGYINSSNSNIVFTTGVQTISGTKTFINTGIFQSGIDLQNSKLINYVPELIFVTNNFLISGNYNSDVILINSANQITGTIISGNPVGFNASIIQIGVGNVRITGSGSNVIINSLNSRFRTSGQFAQASILHTGDNKYIMYGDIAT